MERSKSQFTRLLELDRRIRDGKHPNCVSLAKDWEVSPKTIQRDVTYLRDQLGAPIEYDHDQKGFFYSHSNWFLPSISMSEGELLSLLVASRALEQYRGSPVAKELERVFRDIAAMLPGRVSIRPELITARISFTSPPSKPVNEKVWTTVVRGVLEQQAVKLAYTSMRHPEPRDWTIKPYHIANLQGEWYVLGPCEDETNIMQFSLARVTSARLLKKTFELPDDFDIEEILSRVFGRSAVGDSVYDVRLLFEKGAAAWVTDREWHPRQKITTRRNGDIELSFRATGLYELQRWVLSWGHCVTVLEPQELKDMVAAEIGLMAGRKGQKTEVRNQKSAGAGLAPGTPPTSDC